jgi:hypothetical protein
MIKFNIKAEKADTKKRDKDIELLANFCVLNGDVKLNGVTGKKKSFLLIASKDTCVQIVKTGAIKAEEKGEKIAITYVNGTLEADILPFYAALPMTAAGGRYNQLESAHIIYVACRVKEKGLEENELFLFADDSLKDFFETLILASCIE